MQVALDGHRREPQHKKTVDRTTSMCEVDNEHIRGDVVAIRDGVSWVVAQAQPRDKHLDVPVEHEVR